LTFHFGQLALLHCIRWFAADPIFTLFEPPVRTEPRTLQFFWRCLIRELCQELSLLTLTINIKGIPHWDMPMVVAILQTAFKSVERMRFIDTGIDGVVRAVELGDPRLEALGRGATWREMCLRYLRKHPARDRYMKQALLRCKEEVFEEEMDEDKTFFDEVAG
jgi:hypothetical protein